ncbi:MAG: aminodeoxychorismate/anthranilate synthase component II [Candidatus Omnitrophica bacterium]|nr:aminodeoxychorismate/anthranilate synthase component II [Candidatus Omnitrophota bacterium]
MILMLDNYDSFTYNLVQYLGELGEKLETRRNDKTTVEEIRRLAPRQIVISPGPGGPKDAGISLQLIKELGGEIPILGVCLGHQCISEAFGGRIVRASRIMHGKTSEIRHKGRSLFEGLPEPFAATRYHSLILDKDSVPEALEVTAWTDQGEIMGVQHKSLPIWGVQFHPESILTTVGKDMLRNFLRIADSARCQAPRVIASRR